MPPLERHALLRPVSREHHDGLMLCWRIRRTLTRGEDPVAQMCACADFYHAHLLPHFAVEEEAVFPVLGADDPLVKRALAEHRRLTRLFLSTHEPLRNLSLIEEELEAHIRFEERVLFQRVQEVATEEQLEHIDRLHGLMARCEASDMTPSAFTHMRTPRSLAFILATASLSATAQNPMAIPPALETDTFMLTVGEHVHQFYPGVNTTTFGVNGPYLGPTLLMQRGDTARLRVINELPQMTSMHWHGMHVPGDMDGGPQREVMPGEHWDVKYKVENPAGTYWYHPHPHMLTAAQATKGVAGMIIVRDAEEAALDLPRTYGVDDFPVVIQDRRFLANGNMPTAPYGDSVLVNGTPHAYLECPAQVVRLRLLNGANARIFALGFENGEEMHVIAGDGGLLNTPVTTDRLWLSNGERYEVLLDLTGMEGDSLLLMSFGSELPQTVPGANNMLWESSWLNGIDFPVLRIRVTAPTADPVTSIPATLVPMQPWDEALSVQTRTKALTGNGMVGMGMFMIDGQMFNIDVINDTVQLGSVEIWEIPNNSNMAHPMHIHGVSFYVLERNGIAPAPWEQGAKDVVLVDVGETVRLIMRFDHPTDGWPFMYHCHNLLHEDNMMMLQFIVTDMNVGLAETAEARPPRLFPSPGTGPLRFHCPFPVAQLSMHDMQGRQVLSTTINGRTTGTFDPGPLPAGAYHIVLHGKGQRAVVRVIRE